MQSWHNFAHGTTAQLSWYVQILTWLLHYFSHKSKTYYSRFRLWAHIWKWAPGLGSIVNIVNDHNSLFSASNDRFPENAAVVLQWLNCKTACGDKHLPHDTPPLYSCANEHLNGNLLGNTILILIVFMDTFYNFEGVHRVAHAFSNAFASIKIAVSKLHRLFFPDYPTSWYMSTLVQIMTCHLNQWWLSSLTRPQFTNPL